MYSIWTLNRCWFNVSKKLPGYDHLWEAIIAHDWNNYIVFWTQIYAETYVTMTEVDLW